MIPAYYLLLLLHVGAYFTGPYESIKDCVAAGNQKSSYIHWICVQAVGDNMVK